MSQLDCTVEVALANATLAVGEGPHWDDSTGELLFVDILEGNLHRWNPETGGHKKLHFDAPACFLVPRQCGGYVAGLGRRIVSLDWDTATVSTLAEIDKNGEDNRLNDAKCDPAGRLWAGSMGCEPSPAVVERGMGILGCLGVDGAWHQHLEKIDISNGLAWTKDAMYYIDSIPRKVYAFDYDNEGAISPQRVAVDFADHGGEESMKEFGFPDGCCIDAEGMLWVACFSAAKVVRFNPSTGALLGFIKFPTNNITSCCWGGSHYSDLYVTCGRRGVSEEEFRTNQSTAGSIFKISGLGVQGLPPNVYQG